MHPKYVFKSSQVACRVVSPSVGSSDDVLISCTYEYLLGYMGMVNVNGLMDGFAVIR